MRSDDELLEDAIDAYMVGLKGLDNFISQPAQTYHLSFEQYLILRGVIKQPGIKLMNLAAARQVSRSAVSRQLRVLFACGYVKQQQDPHDHRAQALLATVAGRQAARGITAAMKDRFGRWLDLYGRKRGGQLIDFLLDFGYQIVRANNPEKEGQDHD